MKFVRAFSLIAAFTLLVPALAAAREKNQGKVQLPDPIQVGSTQLMPGDYKVDEWNGTGRDSQFCEGPQDRTAEDANFLLLGKKIPGNYVARVAACSKNNVHNQSPEMDC